MRTDKQNISNYDPINVYIRDTANTIIASGAYTSPGSYSFTFTPSSSSSDYTLEYYVVDASGLCNFRVDNISISSPSTTYITVCDTLNAGDYRYGFQAQEKDDEVKGKGNSYTTEFRQYDPRLGRWLSIDPKMARYPQVSPYVAYGNNPILFVDIAGDTIRLAGSKNEQYKMLAFLQTLTNDKLKIKNGLVYIDMMNAHNCEKELPIGTDLVRDLVSHKRTTLIRLNNRGIKQADHAIGTDRNDEINGVGTNQIVDIDLTHLTKILTVDPENKKSKWTHSAREISLAHELIHAFYGMEGKGYLYEEQATYIYTNENGQMMQRKDRREETETVGLTGNRKYTENKIRKEQGANARARY